MARPRREQPRLAASLSVFNRTALALALALALVLIAVLALVGATDRPQAVAVVRCRTAHTRKYNWYWQALIDYRLSMHTLIHTYIGHLGQ